MRTKTRLMKKYTPRRRRSNRDLQKAQLKDFQKILDMDLGSFLILHSQGSSKQTGKAKTKLRIDLLKYGKDMELIASDLGNGFPEVVRNYLKMTSLAMQNNSGAGKSLADQKASSRALIESIKKDQSSSL